MSKIQWTTETLNPIVGCTKISTGCANCYAVPMSYRLEKMAEGLRKQRMNPGRLNAYQGLTNQGKNWTGKIRFVPEALEIPLSIKSPTTYFVNSMSDLFHEDVPDEWIDQVFAMMAICPHHSFQILTKRPQRMQKYLLDDPEERTFKILQAMESFIERYQGKVSTSHLRQQGDLFPLKNVWLGTSVENQQVAYSRIYALADIVINLRFRSFLSCEPLLSPLDFRQINQDFRENVDIINSDLDQAAMQSDFEFLDFIHWIIIGGESGSGARRFNLEWAIELIRDCQENQVPVFFKQAGSHSFYQGEKLRLKAKKGDDLSELTCLVHTREMPEDLTPKET